MQGRSEADPIKVLLADDHTLFREGIASVLGDYGGVEIVGQSDNDEGAVELARLTRPDVVLMQVQMPIPRAKENLRRMRESAYPAPKVVIVTMIEEPRQVRGLMELGRAPTSSRAPRPRTWWPPCAPPSWIRRARTRWWACPWGC